MATQGELLSPEKWNHTSELFTHPIQPPTNDAFLVVSNYWGPASQTSIMDDTAGVVMGFIDQGTLILRFATLPLSQPMQSRPGSSINSLG
jgi:hypothetical protein